MKREYQRRESVRRKKIQVPEKVVKIAKHCVFPMISGSRGSKSRLAKAAGAEPAGQMRDEKLHAVVVGAKHISKSKGTQRTSSGPLLDVEMSKKCTPLWREAHFEAKLYKTHYAPDHFSKLRCRKSARPCGAKHISKSKCKKHSGFGPLFDVQMTFRRGRRKGLCTLSKVSNT